MPRRPSPLPSTLPFAVFTAAEARRAGVTVDRLRATDIRRLGYGLYARADVEITEIDVLASQTRIDPLATGRSLSAARHWRFPLPLGVSEWDPDADDPAVLLTAGGHARRSTPLLRWDRRRLHPGDIAVSSGVRLTGRVRTWIDLAQELRVEQLVHIGDHLVRIPRPWAEGRSEPYSTPDELATAVQRHPGPGRPRLREALSLIRVGSDSPAETSLRLAALDAGLPIPELNVRQFADGVDLGEPDLAWPGWKVCVEHEGPHHRTPEQQEKDISRRELRESMGWIEVQTVHRDLHRGCRRGVQRTRAALERRGWRP